MYHMYHMYGIPEKLPPLLLHSAQRTDELVTVTYHQNASKAAVCMYHELKEDRTADGGEVLVSHVGRKEVKPPTCEKEVLRYQEYIAEKT